MLQYAIITAITLTALFSISTIPAFADEQRINLGGVLNDFYFYDENNGWIVGDGGLVLHTTDGGNNWVNLPILGNEHTKTFDINGVHFYDDQNGIIVGDTGGVVYLTDNAGKTWTSSSNTDGEIAGDKIQNDVFMLDATHAWVVTDENYLPWYDGSDWDEVELDRDPKIDLNRVIFTDNLFGWAVGDSKNILSTINGGASWSMSDDPIDNTGDDYLDVFFTDRSNGWMIDSDGLILNSINGGQSWTIVDDTFSSEALHDIFFVNENNGWIVGDGGLVLHTTDGGDTWTRDGLNASHDFIRVQYTDDTHGFILDTTGITIITPSPPKDKPNHGGGCSDCTPPTLGLNKNSKRIVDNGFVYNGIPTQVERFHTPYPLINATVGEINKVSIKAFENGGINNMHLIQFGLGAEEIGESLSTLEVLIEVYLETFGSNDIIAVDKIVIRDSDNLIDNDTVYAVAYVVLCQDGDNTPRCVNVDLYYSYREATINHVMVVAASDKKHNNQNFYFNDGVQVLGESLNPAPTYTMSNKKIAQQTEDLTLTLTRVDKVNHIWIDNNGIEYLQISDNRFDRTTPIEMYHCTDDYTINSVVKRNNICQFLPLLNYEISRAENTMNEMLVSHNLDTIEEWNHNNKAFRQYE